jgi:ArsR family transcriptional regulator
MDDDRLALVAKALAHPSRVRIVRLLADQSECRGAEVFSELPLAQSTISQHLTILRDAALVVSHPVGTSSVYCLAPAVLDEFSRELQRLAVGTPDCSDPSPRIAEKE